MSALRIAPILVVDDDPTFRRLPPDLLQAGMYLVEIQTTCNGQEALRALATQEFDVAITDLRMPSMDGVELLRRIRTVQPETPVIVVSGVGPNGVNTRLIEAGAFADVTKLFDRLQFVTLIRRALQGTAPYQAT